MSTGPRAPDERERGQAYTLEGFIGAIIVLTAVLFALQSVVITPTTGGAVDRAAQAQLQQEVKDSLVVAENEGELSHVARYYNESSGDFYHPGGNSSHAAGDGIYTPRDFGNETVMDATVGEMLEQRFLNDSGRNYNVLLTYWNGSTRETIYLVYQGGGSPNEMTASYTVTLADDQRLTAPNSDGTTLGETSEYPIPDVGDGELYNVVEVRVVIW